jgi:hypothetical protein
MMDVQPWILILFTNSWLYLSTLKSLNISGPFPKKLDADAWERSWGMFQGYAAAELFIEP